MVLGERDAVSRDNDATTPYTTPVNLDGDGALERVVSAETAFPGMVKRPLWAFAERSGVWSRLRFLGAGYEALPAVAPRGGYALLCVFERDGPAHFAVEFAWDGASYREGALRTPARRAPPLRAKGHLWALR